MKIDLVIDKDGDGYLAKIKGHKNLFAFAYSEKEAFIELENVVEMIMDYHSEQASDKRIIRNGLATTVENMPFEWIVPTLRRGNAARDALAFQCREGYQVLKLSLS